MPTLRLLVFGVLCWAIIAPVQAAAQQEKGAQDARGAEHGRSWSLYVHGGLTGDSRFLLQRPVGVTSNDRERALLGENAFNVGGGAGVLVMPRVELRVNYTFGSSELGFRDDTGDDSDILDVEDGGKLRSHVAAIELVRYILPARAAVTAYGSAGLVAAWWVLEPDAALVQPPENKSLFRTGAIGTLGLQLKLAEGLGVRLEAASASVRNPFTGRESFRSRAGTTIDEPGRVSKTDFRLAFVYSFGKLKPPLPAANQ